MHNTTVIIPCFNEAKRLNVSSFIANASKIQYNILFVNDGSSDDTISIIKDLVSKHSETFSYLDLTQNGGKAEAIRSGVHSLLKNDSVEYIGYLDADLATTLESMDDIVCFLQENPQFKAIFGIRLKRLGVDVERSFLRHYLGRLFATVTSLFLNLPTYDTQCGAKVLHKDLCESAFSQEFESKWFFDIEILFRLKNKFGKDFIVKQIYEYPIMQWFEEKGSKLSLSNYLLAPFELLKIYFKSKSKDKT